MRGVANWSAHHSPTNIPTDPHANVAVRNRRTIASSYLIVSFAIAARHRNSRAYARVPVSARFALVDLRSTSSAGTPTALQPPLNPEPAKSVAWTIPFHVIMWTTLLVGLIMVIAVVLMH